MREDESLIELVRRFECLWKVQSRAYKDHAKNAWKVASRAKTGQTQMLFVVPLYFVCQSVYQPYDKEMFDSFGAPNIVSPSHNSTSLFV